MLVQLLLILFLAWIYKKNSGRIPGPWIIPMSGSAPSLMLHEPWMLSYPYRAMHKVAAKYGNVMKVGLGFQDWIVLSGFQEIQQFSMAESSVTHLPSKTFDEIYSFDRPLGIIFPDGALWREQRKFGVKTLRELGVGKSSLEDKMVLECSKLIEFMDETINGKEGTVEMADFFDLPCLNIIWGLVNSSRFDYNDQYLKDQINLLNKFTMESAIGPLVAIRSLRYIPPFSFIYNNVKRNMDAFKQYMRDMVISEGANFSDDNLKGYVDHFIQQKNKADSCSTHYEDEQLIVTLIDFFSGGSGTMSKTLSYGILYCTLHPHVAKKVQDELDEMTQGLPIITTADKENLPYTEATVLEVSRLASVLPIAPPRQTTGEIKVGEFTLPKGSLVQMNLYSMHRNKEHWTDPEAFRPERFIEDGKFVPDCWVQPFGYGKRKCIGESVARNNTFLMFANIMRNYSFAVPPKHPLPSTDPVGGLTIGPQKFSVMVAKRG